MRFKGSEHGYSLSLNAEDTETWAHDVGWPCSALAGRSVWVDVDSNGLCDLQIDGDPDCDCGNDELAALIEDHQPDSHKAYWPRWEF